MGWVNVEGTRAVMEVAQELGASKVVYCSIVDIYGDTQAKVIDKTFGRT
ncbi:MAG: hypothetical protein CLLPBCKN_007058 [Chroococcidiopsis cubana SAG 39.79]|uniref:3-beta hydroxysteroid dehydrogenase/isomerase domain-containing protein n=1 Tax=Chroococcidiopsis cubana SAG 39.79 TaxID=388085 RepID=A0AB37U8Y4_9CYAN|nr:NAD-dependent epimerase/dehydratase family protein [Chroococcidiopsis cubana]MDZ4877623.1 hypothetical protein [Chroococcidiopsis cubana SAG 39.79]RUT00887.1 hypothetical protein DSM107010_66890 [Chroococcidiopsis cubana SAG 39.79]